MNKMLSLLKLQDSPSQELAKQAFQSKLFVPGWSLQGVLKRLITNNLGQGEAILLASISEVPVGVSTLSDGHIEVYVKKAYRRYGIGTLLVRTIKQKHKDEFVWGSEGNKGTLKFWHGLGISTH